MLIESDYRSHRIEVNAGAEGDHWHADVTIRRTLSPDKPHHDRVSCYKLSAAHAERAGMLWAKRWIDLQAEKADA